MTTIDHHPLDSTASRGSFPSKGRLLRTTIALLTTGALLQLAGCGTGAPAQRPNANWEPGCTGPASFCVPFFGP
jgi:hypothetical protein